MQIIFVEGPNTETERATKLKQQEASRIWTQ